MKFELSKSFIGVEEIPSLIISASDMVMFKYSGNDEKKLNKINEEYHSLHSIISMYSAYCGRRMFMPGGELRRICNAIDKDGAIVINCFRTGDNPEFYCRWMTCGKEIDLGLNLIPVMG